MKITNAIVESAVIRIDRGSFLCPWVFVKHEDGGSQGFGGYVVGGTKNCKAGDHFNQKNLAAEFIVAVLRACGVEDLEKCAGKAIRVARKGDGWNELIVGIGHIIDKDKWFYPETTFKAWEEGKKVVDM